MPLNQNTRRKNLAGITPSAMTLEDTHPGQLIKLSTPKGLYWVIVGDFKGTSRAGVLIDIDCKEFVWDALGGPTRHCLNYGSNWVLRLEDAAMTSRSLFVGDIACGCIVMNSQSVAVMVSEDQFGTTPIDLENLQDLNGSFDWIATEWAIWGDEVAMSAKHGKPLLNFKAPSPGSD